MSFVSSVFRSFRAIQPALRRGLTTEAPKAKRPLSAYQKFMKEEIPRVKSQRPDLSHKEAFAKAAKNWSTSPQNPKN